MKKFATLLPLILFVAAYNGATIPLPDDNANIPADYVGMTVEQATKKAAGDGVPFRVVQENGEALAVTMDYRPGRINATVENGIVVSYDVEGAVNEAPTTYDQNSWRTNIPDSCMSFFDGCNNCRRTEGGEAGCTKMFCETYGEPACTDEQEAESPEEDESTDSVQ